MHEAEYRSKNKGKVHARFVLVHDDSDAPQPVRALSHDDPGHRGAHVYPPRVAWAIRLSDEEKDKIAASVKAGTFRWWNAPDDHTFDADEIIRMIYADELEFRITAVRPRLLKVGKDGKPIKCRRQPDYPFRQSLAEKARLRTENWYTRVIFDPVPEAFPTNREGCGCGCETHEYEATAEVRLIGHKAKRFPGFEVDPHVIFHGDDDPDEPANP